MTSPGLKWYSSRSQGPNQMVATSNGVLSSKPLFEAFQIGAWWYTELIKKSGNDLLVHFEGYGKHEEQEVTPECIRLRSRKAQCSDCHCLSLGADVVVFTVHPHAWRPGSNKSWYSAWYDVKIISKEYRHPLYTCACKYTVQFYSDWSKNTVLKSTRALLEDAMVIVSIGDIAIMQVTLDSPLEILIEKSLIVSEDSIKRQWAKDAYTLDLRYFIGQPLYLTTVTEDARKSLAAVECNIPMIDLTADLTSNTSLKNDIGPRMRDNNTSDSFKDVRALRDLSNQTEAVSRTKLIDLTFNDNLSTHADTGFIEDVCSPDHLVFKNGRKRTRADFPRKAKVVDGGVYAEIGSKRKHARQTNESFCYSSDENSSSYILSSSGSDCEESHDSEHTFDEEEETMGHSHSRSTPVFYGNGGKVNSNVISMDEDIQGEDQGKSTSTKTFYGNTAEKSGHSSSTAVFYGSCANKVDNSSTSNIAKNLKKLVKTEGKRHDHKDLSAEIQHAEHDSLEEVDSISTGCRKRDTGPWHDVDESSECYCNTIQMSSDCSCGVCKACKLLGVEDSIPMTRPASSQGESFNKAQVAAQKNNTERPAKNGQDTHECFSESKSVRRFKVFKKKEVDYKQKRKLEPAATKDNKNANGISLKSRSRTPCSKSQTRLSKMEEGRRNFNDLFDTILKNVSELTRVKMVVRSKQPFSFTEDKQHQVPWEPIIFHELKSTGVDDLTIDDPLPLKELWKKMELAFEEMHGVVALAKQQSEPSQDKASACEHDLVLNEQEGYVCSHCGLLITSIENILPPVLQEKVNHRDHDSKTEAEVEARSTAFIESTEHQRVMRGPLETDMSCVWKLIPELRPLMQKNQVDGFNFLWKNIGALSSQTKVDGGGCIIAHAPGTGKSLLIISFLKTFLHLNSWCRPLIVAPKNMLLAWQKEFEKWKSGIKVQLLQSPTRSSPLEYLKIISEWQKSTSVLIVTYQLFSKLVDDGRACKEPEIQRIGSLLLHIPDILVLDEGHVPRNCSKLRDSLLQIRTRFKILVSGTLFQNNMQELFNLLYLARPNFLGYLQPRDWNKRLDGFDLESDKKQWQTFEEFHSERWTGTSHEQAEVRSGKIFMEEIGTRLEGEAQGSGGDEEFKSAIEQLRVVTSPFIHFYNGDILNTLPGIKEFIVVLQATSLQVSLSTQIKQQTFLETSLSIHPSLLLKWKGPKLPTCLDVVELQAIRGDASQGPKVKFILDLADCCHVLKEKLLVFSQFIQTLELVAEMLQKKFKVATIKGKGRLEERQRTIDEFNETEGSLILLASLTACGEGINLTGASRVVFLDMHWNPARMKQAVARAFRIGQKRIVYTYWLIASVEKEAEKFTRIHKKDWLSRSIFSLGTQVVECNHKVSNPNAEVEDYVLAQLLKSDMTTKSILKVLNYSVSQREKTFCFS